MALHETYRVLKAAPTLGADPEAFIKEGDMIVGSEKVIPPNGLSRIVRDGVQIELHPTPFTCRASLANDLANLFGHLDSHLRKAKNFSVCFTPVVELTPEEMAQLSPEARVLGCQPSLNIYDKDATVNVPADYPVRSAGGHIHIGLGPLPGYSGGYPYLMTEEKKRLIVQLMDILVGNTCVLIDRDPKQALRREAYGRAGEYRLPAYGVEYRTLSNFWLQAHQLWSLVGGLTKLVVGILVTENEGVYTKTGRKDAWGYDTYHYAKVFFPSKELINRVSIEDVRRAINENDVKLAWKNWEGVRDFLDTYTVQQDAGLDSSRTAAFEYFARRIQARAEETGGNGLDAFFKETPLDSWLKMGDQHNRGWEAFCGQVIFPAMKQDTLAAEQVNANLGA